MDIPSSSLKKGTKMQIAVVLYDRFNALDAVGPYEVLNRLPDAEVVFAAEHTGPVADYTGYLKLVAEAVFADVPEPDILLVPGGPGQADQMVDGPLREWLRAADESSMWTTSVCTGSLILAGAGLLTGRRATSHWLAMEELKRLGAEPSGDRVVIDGKYATGAGVSAGIDMALTLVNLIAGDELAQDIQLGIEYDPQPPFDAGSPAKAPADIVAAQRGRSRSFGEQVVLAGTE
jgi:putative intracellular protease/amidase